MRPKNEGGVWSHENMPGIRLHRQYLPAPSAENLIGQLEPVEKP